MDPNSFPTKGNLMLAKNSLALAKQGYELMDKKRNILIKELMDLIEKADKIQNDILRTYETAYMALQKANIDIGINNVMGGGRSSACRGWHNHKDKKYNGSGDTPYKEEGKGDKANIFLLWLHGKP